MGELSNKEKWLAYTDNLSSPQSYLEWAFRFVIGAALERRVWAGFDNMKLFPNTFTLFVGPAGVGKGVAMNPAIELLKFHKRKNFSRVRSDMSMDEKIVVEKTEEYNMNLAEEASKINGKKPVDDLPLFCNAPDATTFQKLILHMSKSVRYINYNYKDLNGQTKLGAISHCSMYFALPEMGSLLRKQTEDTVTYLLGVYDCPEDYIYTTVTRQEDRVRRGCLNILAGCTPEFLETVFDENLIAQGFASRTFFIYAARNRKNVFLPKPLTPEQQQYRLDLLEHIKKLATLYGEVPIERETITWLEEWWNETENKRYSGAHITSAKLDGYRARKNIHVIKVAIQDHFADVADLSIPIPKWRFENAIASFEKEEANMDRVLTFSGNNPVSKLTDKVMKFLLKFKSGATLLDLLCDTDIWNSSPSGKKSLEEVLTYLITTGKIEDETIEDRQTGKVVIKYKLIV